MGATAPAFTLCLLGPCVCLLLLRTPGVSACTPAGRLLLPLLPGGCFLLRDLILRLGVPAAACLASYTFSTAATICHGNSSTRSSSDSQSSVGGNHHRQQQLLQ